MLLFQKTLCDIYLYFVKFPGFPTKGAKEIREWGWGDGRVQNRKKKVLEGGGGRARVKKPTFS